MNDKEVASATRQLVDQVKGALKDYDAIEGSSILINVSLNLLSLGMSAMSKFGAPSNGITKTEMLKGIYKSFCEGHKQALKQMEPELPKLLELTVVEL